MDYFWSPNKGYGKKRRRKEKERKIEREQAKVWIYEFCMDFGMILVHKLLGYELLGFLWRLIWFPFLGFC